MPIMMIFKKTKSRRMQWQIVLLIISFASHVTGIKNGGDSEVSPGFEKGQENSVFFPSEQLSQSPAARQTNANFNLPNINNGGFRPSQIIEFTHTDAASANANTFPISYLESKHYPLTLDQQNTPIQAKDKQFTFPTEQTQTVQRQQYNQYQSTSASIPTELQTTPIVTYVDPYTSENINYKPSQQSQPSNNVQYYQREAPQAYTVQSTLLVGTHQRPTSVQSEEEIYLKRPGYVFDDKPPIYGSYSQRPVHPTSPSHFLPTRLPTTISTRPPPTPPPIHNQKISYDSHDYPPPSYSSQQTSNFVQLPERFEQHDGYQQNYIQKPQKHRQRIDSHIHRPFKAPASSIYESSYAPNYANNFGNYLQGSLPQQQQYQFVQNQPQQYPENYKLPSQQRPFNYETRPHQSGPSNYYQYQIGEIPPPPVKQHGPNYRPPTASSQPVSSLATLASLFGGSQQYAPQFTSLFGAGGPTSTSSYPSPSTSSSSNPLGSILGAFTGSPTQSYLHSGSIGGETPGRPLNTQLIKALENIARNDDLECVPKVLCQMIAAQTQRGQLPSFITSPAITNFLTGFPVASPALIYGRAALLGISGGERSCAQTYAKCPKNEYEILHYLNNHRGGFFKFFSEPDGQASTNPPNKYGVGSESNGGSGSSSLFSILSALTGNSIQHSTPTTTRRPTMAAPDIADSIGNFFTRVLSEYLSGVEYQRRRRRTRRSLRGSNNYQTEIKADIEQDTKEAVDFHDEEDDLDTRNGISFQKSEVEASNEEDVYNTAAHDATNGVVHFPTDEKEKNIDSRILKHKGITAAPIFFPEAHNSQEAQRLVIFEFNRDKAHRKIKFPKEQNNKDSLPHDADLGNWDGLKLHALKTEFNFDRPREKRVVFQPNANLPTHDFQYDQVDGQNPIEVNLEEQHEDKEIVFHDNDAFTQDQTSSYREDNQDLSNSLFIGKRIVFQKNMNREKIQFNDRLINENKQTPNAVYENSAPPQRGARILFPDHYERFIRKGRILNRPTYAPSYENYLRDYSNERDKFVVSDSHRVLITGDEYEQQSNVANYYGTTMHDSYSYTSMNQGEYLPNKSTPFLPTIKPNHNQHHYDYPNTNYVSDNRYSNSYQKPTKNPRHEDDKNIYINNAQGITEYYVTPDGRKIYL